MSAISTKKALRRSRSNRMIAGVCGGLADYLGTDPLPIRLLFVVFTFAGAGLLLYLLMWVLVPEEALDDASPKPART